MKEILFVCTWNVFRSMSAEKIFNKYRINQNRIADSCGTFESTQDFIDTYVIDSLNNYNIDVSNHKRKKITKKLISEADVIIAIAESHKQFIKKTFGINAYLFNQVYKNSITSIDDIEDVNIDKNNNENLAIMHVNKTIEYIYKAMPQFIKNLNKY